jgi:hypothetical protein
MGWGIETVAGNPPASEAQARDGACTIHCADLGENLLPRHLVGPFGIVLSAWALAAVPTLVLMHANQIQGVRACLWPLVQLGLHLFISQILFRHTRVWAFAWAMAPTAVLARWGPPKRSMTFQAAQRWVALLGVAVVCLYVWNRKLFVCTCGMTMLRVCQRRGRVGEPELAYNNANPLHLRTETAYETVEEAQDHQHLTTTAVYVYVYGWGMLMFVSMCDCRGQAIYLTELRKRWARGSHSKERVLRPRACLPTYLLLQSMLKECNHRVFDSWSTPGEAFAPR